MSSTVAWQRGARPVYPKPRSARSGPTRSDPTIIDVRQRNEYISGHVPGAVNIELGSLPDAVDAVPPGPITVMCGHGERAMTAASILAARPH